jgi:phosphatidylethanolamine/phosphatidyl-N-methylethanolamine N-methyltransferase
MISPGSVEYQSFIDQFHLNTAQSIAQFFVVRKNDVVESIQVKIQRVLHFFQTGVWISENALFEWATNHPDPKISDLLNNRRIQRRVRRYELKMVVPSASFWDKCISTLKFFCRFLQDFKQIGAIAPSSSSLAKEITSKLVKDQSLPPRRILEIGPGTGSFTDKIVKRMNFGDTLDLVEFDKKFVDTLTIKYGKIPGVRIYHQSILDYSSIEGYDHVVSGLPLNSFSNTDVKEVFKKYTSLLKKGGTLSYFDYLFLPTIKQFMLNKEECVEFDRILAQKEAFFNQYGTSKATVPLNAPPARVLHHTLCH